MKKAIPEAILRQHIAILGKTGSGKTSTAKLAVEQVVESGARVCILDPIKSDWWGLTSNASGKRAGLPFRILGGPRGHVPLHSSAGKVIGELVGKGKLRLSILDMADFEPGGLQKFFVDFAQSLFKHARGVVYLVMEEAHEFAPKEKSGIGNETMAVYWAKRLATGSRTKGIRLILPTQRAQALHNALLGSCDTLIAHRLTLPADQAPAEDWLKKNVSREIFEQVTSSFAQLPTGSAWICSGEAQIFERVQFPRINTYDNSATPIDDSEHDVKTAAVDADELRSIIGEAVKEAEANDPKALKAQLAAKDREIAALKRQKPTPAPANDKATLAEAEARGVGIGKKQALTAIGRFASDLSKSVGRAAQACSDAQGVLGALSQFAETQQEAIPTPAPRQVASPRLQPSLRPPQCVSAPVDPDRPLGAERKPLQALASVYPAGLTESQWAVMAGLKRKGGTWSTYLSRLRTSGRIEKRGDLWFATEQGIADLGSDIPTLPAPGLDLVEFWAGKIPAAGPMLKALAVSYPRFITREDLAEYLNLAASGGTFSTYLSRLRSPGLIEENGSELRVSPSVMEAA